MTGLIACILMFAGWAGMTGAVIILDPDKSGRPPWLTAAGFALLTCALTAFLGGGTLGMVDDQRRNKAAADRRRFIHRRRRRRKRRIAHRRLEKA